MPSFTDFKDIIGGQNLKKMGYVTLSMPIREYIVIPRLTLDIFVQQQGRNIEHLM